MAMHAEASCAGIDGLDTLRGGLANCVLHHRVGATTDVIALRQLPLTIIDVAVVFADVNENDVHAHGGSELQIADSEAITSTVLLRELHAQAHAAALKAGGRGLPPLNIVTQVVDVLTQRLLHAEPHLLEPKAVETGERHAEPPKVESI